MSHVLAVVGGQYGSEGKGVIVAHIAGRYNVHVRVGGPNAGHSFYHRGRKWAMQAIPCGWINPNADLFIASGGLIEIETLRREFAAIYSVDPTIRDRMKISPKAGILEYEHHKMEGGVEGEIHQRIGSTGEGVGAARIARIARQSFKHAKDMADEELCDGITIGDLLVKDAIQWLPEQVANGRSVLLEGTQGFGLSLIHGPWPYVTSADTSAGQLVADCGLSPRDVTDIMLVVRTFPIRVAGNSGPMEAEISWEKMSEIVGRKVEERTTVTKKVRRIGMWDEKIVRDAIAVNRPTALACTFLDYVDPTIAGETDPKALVKYSRARSFVEYLELFSNIKVEFAGTGGQQWSVMER